MARPTKIKSEQLKELIESSSLMTASDWGRKFGLNHGTILKWAKKLNSKGYDIKFNVKSPSENLMEKL